MSDPRRRADFTSRVEAPDAWDAGLHAESDAGPIDVGLSIEPGAVGVLVEAPGVGRLSVAFDVAADGTTRLSTASRRNADGTDSPIVVIDESRVLQLEGEVQRAQARLTELDERLGVAISERDEARDRAAILSDDKRSTAEARTRAEEELSSLTTALQLEKEHRLTVLNEREKLKAELDRTRDELDAGSATLMRELTEARSHRDEVVIERDRLDAELSEVSGRVVELSAARETAAEELENLKDQLAKAAQHAVNEERLRGELESTRVELEGLQNERTRWNADLAELTTARDLAAERFNELSAMEAEVSRLRSEVDRLESELQETRGVLASTPSSADFHSTQSLAESRGAEIERLDAELSSIRTLADDRRSQLERLEAEIAESKATAEARAGDISRLETDLLSAQTLVDDRRSQIERLEAELNETRGHLQSSPSSADFSAAQSELSETRNRLAAMVPLDELNAALAEQARLLESIDSMQTELTAAQQALTEAPSSTEVEELRAQVATVPEIHGQLDAANAELHRLSLELQEAQNVLAHSAPAEEIDQLRAQAAMIPSLQGELEAAQHTLTFSVSRDDYDVVHRELEALRAEHRRLEADLARRDDSISLAMARTEAVQAELTNESVATREAREFAVKLKAQAEKLLAERDEARGYARNLHAKVAAAKAETTALVGERDKLTLQVESLGRMLDQEREGRAKALGDRDAWKARASSPDHPTVEIPAVDRGSVTDPVIPKKGGR